MELNNSALCIGNMTYWPQPFVTRKLNRERAISKTLLLIIAALAAFSIVSTLLLIGCFTRMAAMKSEMSTMGLELEASQAELEMMKDQYIVLDEGYEELLEKNETLSTSVKSMMKVNEKLESQNKELAAQDDIFRAAIAEYESREELFDKYSYAIIRSDGSRTDITYDQVRSVEEMSGEEGIDTDLILSMVMVESGGEENAESNISTARGYGQLLAGTGKFVYEKILDKGRYNHDKALEGDMNLKLMVTYLSYLDEKHGNLWGAIKEYRGEDGDELQDYISRIDSFLIQKNKSVLLLSNS